MASQLDEAKKAITGSSETDPDLDEALSSAQSLQLSLEKEKNRHEESRHKTELGWGGIILGGEQNAPIFVAGLAVLFGLVSFWVCLSGEIPDVQKAEFWGRHAERSLAFAAAALAYLFGRGAK